MIYSMTAFARNAAQHDWGSITWEIRSVNHRFLDCSFKLPEIFRFLEMEFRDIVRQKIQRGRIDCFLQYKPLSFTPDSIAINAPLLQTLAYACDEVKKHIKDTASLDPLQVLNWPGVLQANEINQDVLKEAAINLFHQTIDALNSDRAREGAALKELLMQKLKDVAAAAEKIQARFPEVLAAQRLRLTAKLQELKSELNTERLEQEMVYFAQKIDISEEIERLRTHVKEMENILKKEGTVGKRLDFLLQEFNRETNTTASKSVDSEITQIALDTKVIIEQMREQVQNVE